MNILKIHNNISFQFKSAYENLNFISCGKLINDKSLQTKLKNYLIEEIQNLSFRHNSGLIKKTNSFAGPLQFNNTKNKFIANIGANQRRSTSIVYNKNNMHLTYKKTKKKQKRSISSLHRRSKTQSSISKIFNRSSSVKERNVENPKKDKNKFQTGIGNELGSYKFGKNRVSSQKGLLFNNNALNNIHNNNSNLDFHKRVKSRKSAAMLTTFVKTKKKKDNILSKINFNIQKTNQNLNNPDEFYSNYFNALLEGEITKKNQKNNILFGYPMTDNSKVKKEKEKYTKIKGTVIK